LRDTQIGLVEAEDGIAIIPSFGLPACRSRKIAMSELVDPTVNFELYEISSRGKKLPEDAAEFSAFLKKYIARWAGEAGACSWCENGVHTFSQLALVVHTLYAAKLYCVRNQRERPRASRRALLPSYIQTVCCSN
jgi:hypothetical protein